MSRLLIPLAVLVPALVIPAWLGARSDLAQQNAPHDVRRFL